MKENIFNINRIGVEEGTLLYEAGIVEDHPIFKGHFPNNPIVPGVCTMEMIKECISNEFSCKAMYVSVKECKFLSALIPTKDKLLGVTLHIAPQVDNCLNMSGEVVSGDLKIMKIKAILRLNK